MDAIDLLRQQTEVAWSWLESILEDVTEEQANWQPGGAANSIAAGYAHLVVTADNGYNTQLKGQMPIIATDFKGEVGLSEPFNARGGWRDWSSVRANWETLRTYGRAVHEEVLRHVETMTPEDLERRVDMTPHGLGVWKGLQVFTLHGINHPRLHGGEIACLKGLQGVQGYAQAPSAFP
jgi:DinB family protein